VRDAEIGWLWDRLVDRLVGPAALSRSYSSLDVAGPALRPPIGATSRV